MLGLQMGWSVYIDWPYEWAGSTNRPDSGWNFSCDWAGQVGDIWERAGRKAVCR